MGNESVVKEERQRKDQIWSEAEVVTLKKQGDSEHMVNQLQVIESLLVSLEKSWTVADL